MKSRAFAFLFACSIAGCSTDPDPRVEEPTAWPCGSIETGGTFGLANVHARYEYDDLHNVVWSEETSHEQGPNYGKVLQTETKTFVGKIAVAEELVASDFHLETTRDLVDGRIVGETHIQYRTDGPNDITNGVWTYDGERVVRTDFKDATTDRPKSYSVFTYPDANTRVERSCWFDYYYGGEHCREVTLVGGADTWTTRLTDESGDGDLDQEEVRTFDANGLPVTIESYDFPGGTRKLARRTVIERRADGAPLFMDDGFTQTEYVFSCE
ncbi:MAG: hypothetical protein HOV81_39145 [Kofleriaceae bacterium]|nr:hypothetical protein [Kofleriaceae bacterium]